MDIEVKSKEIMEIKDTMPTWKRWVASFINHSAVILWVVLSYLLLKFLFGNPDLLWGAALYLSVVGPASIYGLLTLIAGMVIMTYLNPFIRQSRYLNGTDADKYCYTAYLIGAMLSLALIIFGCN